jgi:hypothetical protein
MPSAVKFPSIWVKRQRLKRLSKSLRKLLRPLWPPSIHHLKTVKSPLKLAVKLPKHETKSKRKKPKKKEKVQESKEERQAQSQNNTSENKTNSIINPDIANAIQAFQAAAALSSGSTAG